MKHVIVYQEAGRYAGWPANYGIWSWGNEIVVGFVVGTHQGGTQFHAIDKSHPSIPHQARSFDGGETWSTKETPAGSPGNRGFSADEHMEAQLQVATAIDDRNKPRPLAETVDFTAPDFALMCARTGLGEGSKSWFYCSQNRCQSWQGPYELPAFGQPGISARTDYIVKDSQSLILLLTAVKSNGQEGRVFSAQTVDGGRSFQFLSWLGPEPEGYQIMPATLRISDNRLITAVRCAGGSGKDRKNWIDLYQSNDGGNSWTYLDRPVPDTGRGGNPPTLTALFDGRICITYAHRDSPYRICARLSEDQGKTWSKENVLRDDGGSHDIGYPRTVQRADGNLVTVYYFNERLGGPAYIAATVWNPSELSV